MITLRRIICKLSGHRWLFLRIIDAETHLIECPRCHAERAVQRSLWSSTLPTSDRALRKHLVYKCPCGCFPHRPIGIQIKPCDHCGRDLNTVPRCLVDDLQNAKDMLAGKLCPDALA